MISGTKINIPSSSPRILIAPLEWGLGHATRCIPIINELIQQNCEVIIAAEGATQLLLKNEFPRHIFLPLMGYRMRYSRKKSFLLWKILSQLPKMMFTIFNEHQWIKKIVQEYKIDAVISDNRFGMYHKKIPSIYISHQLLIKTGSAFTEKIAQRIHYLFINKYKECWVPDFRENGLAGELSHPKNLPKKIKYLGALSRFELKYLEIKYDLLISISGPEPQRTIFEEQLFKGLNNYKGRVLFIRGLPDANEEMHSENSLIEIKNHLSAEDFNKAILQSEMIVSRCGYTTIMDLVKLKKKAILIPTPGQTEQEYLAKYLMEKNMFYTVDQKDFVLKDSINNALTFPFKIPDFNMEMYQDVIDQFVKSL